MSSPIQFTIIAIHKTNKTKFICFPHTELKKSKKKIDSLIENHISFSVYTANYIMYECYHNGIKTQTFKVD